MHKLIPLYRFIFLIVLMIHSSKGSVLDDLSKDGKSVAELKQRVL